MKPGMDHESASEMMTEMAARRQGPKPGAMKLDNMTVKPAANGGYVVSCSRSAPHTSGNMPSPSFKSDDYAFSNLTDAMAFITEELGGTPEAPPDETEEPSEDEEMEA